MLERLYGLATEVGRALAPLLGLASPRLARLVAERRGAAEALLAAAATTARDSPLLWLHGASAGELISAAPVLRELRARRQLRVIVTYTSPSAASVARELSPDFSGFLPIDTRREMTRVIEAWRPSAIAFAKTDVWPALTQAAERVGVPMAMLNATVSAGSSRLSPAARRLLRLSYRRLEAIGAATAADADRLASLGARPHAVQVTGDAAFERALGIVDRAREDGSPLPPPDPSTVRLVAGSTWPADEDALLAAARSLAGSEPSGAVSETTGGRKTLELVLVPHEPTEAAVDRLRGRCLTELGRYARVWSEDPGVRRPAAGPDGPATSDVDDAAGPGADDAPGPESQSANDGALRIAAPLVVDEVGLLAKLYVGAHIGYVGGGFGEKGLHAVVEPAAAGLPVVFGPRHDRWEAEQLLQRGAAWTLDTVTAPLTLAGLVFNDEARERSGRAARTYVEEGGGAAEAGADLLERLLAD